MAFTGVKPSLSASNVPLKANPGTVLITAHSEDSKAPPTWSNLLTEIFEIKDK